MFNLEGIRNGGIAQLGEHLLCKQGVSGSIPLISTIKRKLVNCTLKTEQRKKKEKQGNREAKSEKLLIVEHFVIEMGNNYNFEK